MASTVNTRDEVRQAARGVAAAEGYGSRYVRPFTRQRDWKKHRGIRRVATPFFHSKRGYGMGGGMTDGEVFFGPFAADWDVVFACAIPAW
jgi:hypothetical protein